VNSHAASTVSPSSSTGGSNTETLNELMANLSENMTRQGVSTESKGLCAACSKPIIGQVATMCLFLLPPTFNQCSKWEGMRWYAIPALVWMGKNYTITSFSRIIILVCLSGLNASQKSPFKYQCLYCLYSQYGEKSCSEKIMQKSCSEKGMHGSDLPQYCFNCPKFGKLILRKIIVSTRCHILQLECTKLDFGWALLGELTVLPRLPSWI